MADRDDLGVVIHDLGVVLLKFGELVEQQARELFLCEFLHVRMPGGVSATYDAGQTTMSTPGLGDNITLERLRESLGVDADPGEA